MTVREWKPGDVALLQCRDGVERVAILTDRGDLSPLWIAESPDWGRLHDDVPVRPLVVIDPEDREQVERLWAAWRDLAPDHRLAQDNLQAALRSLIAPPLEEPQGLGAVVENTVGERFLRTAKTDFPWVRVSQPDGNAFHWTEHRSLDGHPPAKILSAGWSE